MRTALWFSVVVVAGCVCAAPSSTVVGAASKAGVNVLTIRVSGDVQAALIDSQGRRTGWYGGWFEDIPNCQLEAIRDEVVEPHDYVFRLKGPRNQDYGLLVTPRTEGQVSLEIEGVIAGKRACFAQADTNLVAGESEWSLRWTTSRAKCRVSMVPVPRAPRRD
jgi:hypothetical protein